MVVSPKTAFSSASKRLIAISALVVTLPCLISIPPALSKDNSSFSKRPKNTQNAKYTFTIQPQFTSVSEFSEGFASVYIGYRKGYINNVGKVVIPAVFDGAGEFSEGLAWVNMSGKWGYINKKGLLAINPLLSLL
ncbi:MAG: WG repeat-containing protein [Rivularia sp. ALOHA_DT_140]|nr:WG repeat-containing protein [Rivularia sp. ALOHA_DT_140]